MAMLVERLGRVITETEAEAEAERAVSLSPLSSPSSSISPAATEERFLFTPEIGPDAAPEDEGAGEGRETGPEGTPDKETALPALPAA